MPRRRKAAVALPTDIDAVSVKRKCVVVATYHYFHRGRGTDAAGKRIALGKDPTDPEFWKRYRAAAGFIDPETVAPGSVRDDRCFPWVEKSDRGRCSAAITRMARV